MSYKIVELVFDHSAAKDSDLTVLVLMAAYSDKYGGKIWPAVSTISRRTGISERRVREAYKNLELAGEVFVDRNSHMNSNKQTTNYCQINKKLLLSRRGTGFIAHFGCVPRGAGTAPLQSDKGCRNQQEEVQESAKGGAGVAPNPSSYPSEEKREATNVALSHSSDSESAIKSWQASVQLENVCIWFARYSGMAVTSYDKGKWLSGAERINALGPTEIQMYKAIELAKGKGFSYTHPGNGIYEFLKEVMAIVPTVDVQYGVPVLCDYVPVRDPDAESNR